MERKKTLVGIFLCTFFFVMLALFTPLNAAVETPARIAILPFAMHTPSDLAYLRDGVRDMLASRLAWQGKVEVIDKTKTEQALKKAKSDINTSEAIRVGNSLGADYVLFGSITALGQSISIDAKMVPVKKEGEPVNLYAQTNNLDEVIPKINQFAQEINQKIFARPTELAQASTGSNAPSTRNPELLIPEGMLEGNRISYLNPNFIEVTPEGSLRKSGIWRSQTFKSGILGMDIGDLDGDGRLEIVTVSYKKVAVHRKEGNALRTIATYKGTQMDKFIWVSLVDTNRDGKDEIYVTKLLRRNNPLGNTDSRKLYGRDVVWVPASLGLEFNHGKLSPLFDNALYLLNGVEFPKRGKILLGQQKGTDTTLSPEIYEMQLKGRKLKQLRRVQLPKRCNIFNFAKADINNDNADEYIVIDQGNRLLVLDAAGNQIWKGRHRFAATSNSFQGKVTDISFNQIDYFYLPSPIIVTDLNHDNILEIVVNRSPDYSIFFPQGMKYYGSGEIVSLSWDQLGMIENWKTREIGGMVTSIRIGDLNKDGVKELIATMVLAKDFLKLWESRSTVFSYDLNVGAAKTAQLRQ